MQGVGKRVFVYLTLATNVVSGQSVRLYSVRVRNAKDFVGAHDYLSKLRGAERLRYSVTGYSPSAPGLGPLFDPKEPLGFEWYWVGDRGQSPFAKCTILPLNDVQGFLDSLPRVHVVSQTDGLYQLGNGALFSRIHEKYIVTCDVRFDAEEIVDADKLLRDAYKRFCTWPRPKYDWSLVFEPRRLRPLLKPVEQAILPRLQRRDGENSASHAFRSLLISAAFDSVQTMVKDAESIELGVDVDPEKRRGTFDLNIRARKKSKLARAIRAATRSKCKGHWRLRPESVLAVGFSLRIPEAFSDAARKHLGKISKEDSVEVAGIEPLLKVIDNWIDAGKVEGDLLVEASSRPIVMRLHLPVHEREKLELAITELLTLLRGSDLTPIRFQTENVEAGRQWHVSVGSGHQLTMTIRDGAMWLWVQEAGRAGDGSLTLRTLERETKSGAIASVSLNTKLLDRLMGYTRAPTEKKRTHPTTVSVSAIDTGVRIRVSCDEEDLVSLTSLTDFLANGMQGLCKLTLKVN